MILAISITLFVVTLIAFLGFLALWVYEDAKIKSNQSPAMWVLAVILIPNMMGFIMYLLVGRTNKFAPASRKFKYAAIASAICFAIGTTLFVIGVTHYTNIQRFSEFGARQMGSFTRLEESLQNGVWQISAERANGYIRRNPALTAEELEAFSISFTGYGSVSLQLEQDGSLEIFSFSHHDVHQPFIINPDLRGFTPGRITAYLKFENAENINIVINWR